jgi:hypothetical protein
MMHLIRARKTSVRGSTKGLFVVVGRMSGFSDRL